MSNIRWYEDDDPDIVISDSSDNRIFPWNWKTDDKIAKENALSSKFFDTTATERTKNSNINSLLRLMVRKSNRFMFLHHIKISIFVILNHKFTFRGRLCFDCYGISVKLRLTKT